MTFAFITVTKFHEHRDRITFIKGFLPLSLKIVTKFDKKFQQSEGKADKLKKKLVKINWKRTKTGAVVKLLLAC